MKELRQKPSGCSLAFVAWLIHCGWVAVVYARGWTNIWDGLINGLVHSLFYSVSYILVFLPLICLVLYSVCRRRLSPLLRSVLVLSPVLICVCITGLAIIMQPLTDRGAFKRDFGFDLPADVSDFQSIRDSVGYVDAPHMFLFSASPRTIENLLHSKPYQLDSSPITQTPVLYRFPRNWPDPNEWRGAETYQYWEQDGIRVFTIVVDRSRGFVLAYIGYQI